MNYYLTPLFILRKIKAMDEETIFRKRNIIKFTTTHNVLHHKVGNCYLIDFEDFMKTINPLKINKSYPIPRIRTVESATKEYNRIHKPRITHHVVADCLKKYKDEISYLKSERQYLINYDELEKQLIKFMKEKNKFIQ